MAMNKQRRTSNINNIVVYDAIGNVILPASLTVKGFSVAGFVKTDANGLLSVDTGAYLPFPSQVGNSGKYLTTDGSILSWADVVSGVSSFNTRTGAVTLNSSDVTTALGYTPVTNARTLTINGTAYDLSADRSWTVSGSATPAGSNTQIQYNNSGVFGASAGLTYNDSTGAFALTKNINSYLGIDITNANSGTNSEVYLSVNSDSAAGSTGIGKYSSTHSAYRILSPKDGYLINSLFGNLAIYNNVATGKINFAAGAALTAQMTLTSAGRLLLGTTIEGTNLLDVNGRLRVVNAVIKSDALNNFSIGTGDASTPANGNTNFIGFGAGENAGGSSNSNFFGRFAGFNALSATDCNFIGLNSGNGASSLFHSNFMGSFAGFQSTNAYMSNFFGNNAGFQASAANQSNFFGTDAGRASTNASNSNFFGRGAGGTATNASNSNFFGNDAGTVATNASFSNFFGLNAGYQATSASHSNFFGRNAGLNATGASFSTFIGFNIGNATTHTITGTNNILIGLNITTPTAASANMFSIGNVLYGFNTHATTSGNPTTAAQTNGQVSIGTNSPNASAVLQADSTNRGFLPPRLSTAQRDAIATPATGLQIYNTTTNENNTFNGTAWVAAGGANIYTASGSLTSARALTLNAFNLDFVGSTHTNRITAAGRLLLGTTTESTFLLDVNGTARVSGALYTGTTSNVGIWMQDGKAIRGDASTGGNLYIDANSAIDNSGTINLRGQVSASSTLSVSSTLTVGGNIFVNDGRSLRVNVASNGSLYLDASLNMTGNVYSRTSNFTIESTSGAPSTNLSALLQVNSTTKGFLPPRMTTTQKNAIATPAAGLVVYDNTDNYLSLYNGTNWQNIVSPNSSSNVLIGTVIDGGQRLQVNGNAQVTHTYNHTSGSFTSGLTAYTNSTTAASSSFSNGMFYGALNTYYRNTVQGNITIANGAIAASQFNGTQIVFSAANTAITMTQATGIRAYSSQILQFSVDNAQASCSVSHVAGIQILAPYYQSTNNPTISNYYGIVLNDSSEYSANITVTNRWAIYQDGASDNNYFKGKVVIGNTNTVGVSSLNIKNLPTSSAGLASGDIWNNGGVLNIV